MSTASGAAFKTAAVRYDERGLAPAVVADADGGGVLMLGWMDAEALRATLDTGEVHFHSRSRDRLWRKGETSGNTLALVSLALDCDGDTILVRARPAGPTCHRGTRSCFDPPGAASDQARAGPGFGWLDELWATIEDRVARRPAESYTASLVAGGVDAVGRKVAEEATEVVLAAKDDAARETTPGDRTDTRTALAGELADLLYHALVLAAERRLPASEIVATLRARHRPG